MLIADAGTPLMWAGFFHLTAGNLIVGFLEAWIVRRWFGGKPTVRLFLSIIAANYVSCIGGYLLISAFAGRIIGWVGGPLPVYSLDEIVIVLAAASFMLTLLIEYPFFWFGLRRQRAGTRKSVWATLVANGASYLVLIFWYWAASARPAQWGVRLVRADQLPAIHAARVYYISRDGGSVMQMRLDGSEPRRVCGLASPAPYGALGFERAPANKPLQLEIQTQADEALQKVAEVEPGLADTGPSASNWTFAAGGQELEEPPKWTVWCGNWPALGIIVSNIQDGSGYTVMAVEMPWVGWTCCNATVLPNDQMVFQLGEQIMRVDLKRREAAAVAAGHGPVVVMDK